MCSCGGGGGSTGAPGFVPGGAPTPTPVPTAAPPAVSSSAGTVSRSGPTTVSLPPAAGGVSGTVVLTAASTTATVAVTLSATPPAGAPSLQSNRRLTQAIGAPATGLAYLTAQASADVSFNSTFGANITVPGPVTGAEYLVMYDPANAARRLDPRQHPRHGERRDRARIRQHRARVREGRDVRSRADLDADHAHAALAVTHAVDDPVADRSPVGDSDAHGHAVTVTGAYKRVAVTDAVLGTNINADTGTHVHADANADDARHANAVTNADLPRRRLLRCRRRALWWRTSRPCSSSAVGTTFEQTITVTQANYNGLFALGGTSCNGITAADTTVSLQNFTITPLAAGTCSYTLSGGGGVQATLPVTVTTLTIGGH